MSSETPKHEDAGDPSMEEILSSIRRILSEDESAAPPAGDDVLVLDPGMMVEKEPAPSSPPPEPAPVAIEPAPVAIEPPQPVEASPPEEPAASSLPQSAPVAEEAPLLAPDAAESAAASILGLVRTLAADRLTPVHRSGPTIEDLVREEIRPLLKAWLDAHLPALVERLVRNEIERVVNRTIS